jgi:hypothetical protein
MLEIYIIVIMSKKITIILYWCLYMVGVCLILVSDMIQKCYYQLLILIPPVLQLIAYILFYKKRRPYLEVMFPAFLFFQQLILIIYKKQNLTLSCYYGYIGIHAIYISYTSHSVMKWISNVSLIFTIIFKIYYFTKSDYLINVGVTLQIFGCYFLFYSIIQYQQKSKEKWEQKKLDLVVVIVLVSSKQIYKTVFCSCPHASPLQWEKSFTIQKCFSASIILEMLIRMK